MTRQIFFFRAPRGVRFEGKTPSALPNCQPHPLPPPLQGPSLRPQGFAWPGLWPPGSRSGLLGNSHSAPQSTPSSNLSLAIGTGCPQLQGHHTRALCHLELTGEQRPSGLLKGNAAHR